MTMRVQIPAYTDRFMMGDKYGEVVKINQNRRLRPDRTGDPVDIAWVKLDKSGKRIRVILDDCTVVDA